MKNDNWQPIASPVSKLMEIVAQQVAARRAEENAARAIEARRATGNIMMTAAAARHLVEYENLAEQIQLARGT